MEEKAAQKFAEAMERLCQSARLLAEGLQECKLACEKMECDFCTALKEANEQNRALKVPPVYCELNGVITRFSYCPECGRKL